MERREFLLSLAAVTLRRAPTLRIDADRLNRNLSALSAFGRTPEGGVSRVAYSTADRDGRELVAGWMRDAGLETEIDLAGNLVGRRAGADTNLPPIVMGSHTDSVPHGGNYDGPVGVLGAVEVAHTLSEASMTTRHPLEVVVFQNEENGKTGSRAMVGEVESRELELPSHTDKRIGEGIAFIGGDPDRLDQMRRREGDVAAYLELHIEQGAVLDQASTDIGVVEGIVGIKRWNVTIEGKANHAGTTPMDQRRDAVLTAGRFIDAVHEVATGMPGRQVATIGKMEVHPGAPNVVPGRVDLTLEIRDLAMATIDGVVERVQREAERIARQNQTTVTFEPYYVSRAAPTDERLRRQVEAASTMLGLSHSRMPSGAGHDAQSIALIAPAGMIFIPSVDGISHSPKEFSRPEDIEAGANVLLQTLLGTDEATTLG